MANTQIPQGHWQPGPLPKDIYYGSGCVARHLLFCLAPSSRVFVITNTSLSKTPLLPQLESILGAQHAGTISSIKQHVSLSDIEDALSTILSTTHTPTPITLLSLGGGSAIDATKIISYKYHSATRSFLPHIAIPTTLSGAECTPGGSYTITEQSPTTPVTTKKAIIHPDLAISTIFYDPIYAAHTPPTLWLSTGIRALDHATECMYHPLAAEVPWKALALFAFSELLTCLPLSKAHPTDDNLTVRLMLAAYASSGFKGSNIGGELGLSHRLGHVLGSAYGIPHGITSCMTLGRVVCVKARDRDAAAQIVRLIPGIEAGDGDGRLRTGDDYADAVQVGKRIQGLARELGLEGKLGDYGVERDEVERIVRRVVGDEGDEREMKEVEEVVMRLF
ncbi:Dehydroquinate synthase-like protein [Aspergillus steynii IBT 23096]|uniref:Dehydroquinate synthase-like protein n=1 Tax=Aspergillus steynii IBT 23096 TaxID=1392250 RepID=A0A2I2G409_9EURO|nr:Dehydroquinate synthase-like protein [Aspergillus steynii IBT 23096]PLB47599.1 Dehydroquinate synthase-like protein [Aspergillus steynii IBT 23096]